MRFIALITNDSEGARGMLGAGSVGDAWRREVIARYGGTVEYQVGTIGAVDAVVIADFPSLAVARSFALSSTASGQRVDLLITLSDEEVEEASARAASVYEAMSALLQNAAAVPTEDRDRS